MAGWGWLESSWGTLPVCYLLPEFRYHVTTGLLSQATQPWKPGQSLSASPRGFLSGHSREKSNTMWNHRLFRQEVLYQVLLCTLSPGASPEAEALSRLKSLNSSHCVLSMLLSLLLATLAFWKSKICLWGSSDGSTHETYFRHLFNFVTRGLMATRPALTHRLTHGRRGSQVCCAISVVLGPLCF